MQAGTTAEKDVADDFHANRLAFEPVVFEKFKESVTAFSHGRCDVYTADSTRLDSLRQTNHDNPDQLMVLPGIIPKEPLGPATRKDDDA